MTPIDVAFVVLAVTTAVTSIGILLGRKAHRTEFDKRLRDDYVDDIRAMNTYNSYFMTAIVVFFGFAFGVTDGGSGNELPHSALAMLSLAFVASAASMYYVPMKKVASGTDQADRRPFQAIHSRWLAAINCSQLTVILCVFGVLNIVGGHFMNDRVKAPPARSTPADPAVGTRAGVPAAVPPLGAGSRPIRP